jgi:chromosome segregation ATPase
MSGRTGWFFLGFCSAMAVALSAAGPAAGQTAADAQRARDQSLQQQRNDLDSRINEGRRQIDANNRNREQLRKDIPTLENKIKEAQKIAEQLKTDGEAQQEVIGKLRVDYKAADDRVKAAKDKLDAITDRLEKDQPADSALVQARAAYEKARAKNQAEIDRVLSSPEFKKAYDEAAETGDRVKMGDVRTTFLQADPEAVEAARVNKDAHGAYDTIRDALVYNDSGWQAASDELKQARAEATEIRKKGAVAVKKAKETERKHRDQLAGTKRAQALIERNQQTVQRLEQLKQQLTSQVQQLEQQRNNLR